MSQTEILYKKSVSELSAEVEDLRNRVKLLEASVNSLKLRMGKKWV